MHMGRRPSHSRTRLALRRSTNRTTRRETKRVAASGGIRHGRHLHKRRGASELFTDMPIAAGRRNARLAKCASPTPR